MALKRSSPFRLLAQKLIILLFAVNVLSNIVQSLEFLENLQGCQKSTTMKGVHQLKQYLQKFGYLRYNDNLATNANADEFDELVESALKSYQQFYSLKPSGRLDSDTINQMVKPRCGVPDIIYGNSRISASMQMNPQYAFPIGNPKWPPSKMHLRYTFSSSGVQVFDSQILSPVIARAFSTWASVTNFTFEEVPNDSALADIVISFQRRDHGDDMPFDGSYGVLAHSWAPTIGISHFDADENWSTTQPSISQIDLESIALHEIGHLLGLAHSTLGSAVMFPTLKPGVTKRALTIDDIQGIHQLYGPS